GAGRHLAAPAASCLGRAGAALSRSSLRSPPWPTSSRSRSVGAPTTARPGKHAPTRRRRSRAWASGSSRRTRSSPGSSSLISSRSRISTPGSWRRTPSTIRRSRISPTIPSGRATRSLPCCPRRRNTRIRAAGRASPTRRCSASTTTSSWPTWSLRPSMACRPSGPWTGRRSRSCSPSRGSSRSASMAVGPRVLEAAGLRQPGRFYRLREWWEQEHVFGYGLIVPAIVLLVSLVAFPFGMAIYFSLSDYWVGSPGAFVGLTNYREILGNETFRQTVQNSFVFTGIALTFKVVLGVWLAMLLSRNLPLKRIIRGIVPLPFVIPPALSTLAWLWMFDSLYSVVNWTAIHIHLINPPGPNWLGQSKYAMAAVIAVNVWRGLPFFAITVLAG